MEFQRPFSYREVLDFWDKAQVKGEKRDLVSYAQELNRIYDTDAFSEGLRDGPWTRFSTRLDEALETSPVGRLGEEAFGAVGGAFGYEDAGRMVGRGLPRMLLNTAPLFIPGIGQAGLAARLAAYGGTGLLMGSHTYADTGNTGAAVVSGATGAALPYVGKVGGDLASRVFGAGTPVRGVLTEEGAQALGGAVGSPVNSRVFSSRGQALGTLGGSQAAQFGTMVGSSLAQESMIDPNADLLARLRDDEFWAQNILGQIPFTAVDVGRVAKLPVAKPEVAATYAKAPEVVPPSTQERGRTYHPDEASAQDYADLNAALENLQRLAGDSNAGPADKSAALAAAQAAMTRVDAPKVSEVPRVSEVSAVPDLDTMLTVKGFMRDDARAYIDSVEGADIQLPVHRNVWLDTTALQDFVQEANGDFTAKIPLRGFNYERDYQGKRIGVVKKPISRTDLPTRPGAVVDPTIQPELPPQAVPGTTAPVGEPFSLSNDESAPQTTFKTAKGSNYVLHPDGTTTRDKAARPEHPGDSGPQPRSGFTFYVTEENALALAEVQAKDSAGKPTLRQLRDGRWGMYYTDGPSKGKFEERTVVPVETQPAIGLMPVEMWVGHNQPHFGNVITEISKPKKQAPIPASSGPSGLSLDAVRLLARMEGRENVPREMVPELLRIAKENGVEVEPPDRAKKSVGDTPLDIVDKLRFRRDELQRSQVEERYATIPEDEKAQLSLIFRPEGETEVAPPQPGTQAPQRPVTSEFETQRHQAILAYRDAIQRVENARNESQLNLTDERVLSRLREPATLDAILARIRDEGLTPEEAATAVRNELTAISQDKALTDAELVKLVFSENSVRDDVGVLKFASQPEAMTFLRRLELARPDLNGVYQVDGGDAARKGQYYLRKRAGQTISLDRQTETGASLHEAIPDTSVLPTSENRAVADFDRIRENISDEMVSADQGPKNESPSASLQMGLSRLESGELPYTYIAEKLGIDIPAAIALRKQAMSALQKIKAAETPDAAELKAAQQIIQLRPNKADKRLKPTTQAKSYITQEKPWTPPNVPHPEFVVSALESVEMDPVLRNLMERKSGFAFNDFDSWFEPAKKAWQQLKQGQAPDKFGLTRLQQVFRLRNVNYTFGKQVAHNEAIVQEMGLREGGLPAVLDWYAQNAPANDTLGLLIRDLANLSRDHVNNVRLVYGLRDGFDYVSAQDSPDGVAQINLPWLPSTHDATSGQSSTRFALNAAHEVVHHLTFDALNPSSPRFNEANARQFDGTLTKIREALGNSEHLPKRVRQAISEARQQNLLQRYRTDDSFDLVRWFDKKVGKENRNFLDLFYSLLDNNEMLSNVFANRDLVRLMNVTPRQGATLGQRVLNWFTETWNKLVGLPRTHETALGETLLAFDDYLGKPKGRYNAMDFIRDRLVSRGTATDALPDRIFAVQELLRTGKPSTSLDLNGTATEVGRLIFNMPGAEFATARESVLRLRDEVKIAREAAKRYNISRPELEGLSAKADAMFNEVQRYARAIVRESALDNFDPDGWGRTIEQRMRNIDSPDPADPVADSETVKGLLGLRENPSELQRPLRTKEEVAAEASERLRAGKSQMGFIEKNFMLVPALTRIFPELKRRFDVVRSNMGTAQERASRLSSAFNFDPATGKESREVQKNNMDVKDNERLTRVANDVLLAINQLDKNAPGTASFEHPIVRDLMNQLTSSKEREMVRGRLEAEKRRHTEKDTLWQMYFDERIPLDLANTIVAREGVLPDGAQELARQYYNAVQAAMVPETAAQAFGQINLLAGQTTPATAAKLITQAQEAIGKRNEVLSFMKSRFLYTSEQRYGKYVTKVQLPDRSFATIDADSLADLNKKVDSYRARGAKDVYTINKDDFVQNVDMSKNMLDLIEQVEGQLDASLQASISDLAPEVQAAALSGDSVTDRVRKALEVQKPLPGVARKFSQGREMLNMLDQADQFYLRLNNWMRHSLIRSGDQLHRMHPEIMGNSELRKYGDDLVSRFLTPDDPVARRLMETVTFYKLGFEMGNSFLESWQNMTTGLQAIMAETGTVGDAFAYWGKGFGKTWKNFAQALHGKVGGEGVKLSPDESWLVAEMRKLGDDVATTWNDSHNPDGLLLREQAQGQNFAQKGASWMYNLSRNWSGIFQQYNNTIIMRAAFALGRDQNMSREAAYRYARDIRDRGLYVAGKAQRPGFWNIKTKSVPALMSSLQTYVLGWFSQAYADWRIGFSKNKPKGVTAKEVQGAKNAFLYALAAQATLAGALGLPGIGQGMALLNQATGVDLKGWLAMNLPKVFDEDQQEGGGFLSNLAMNGLMAAATPFDPSNRAAISVPFTGVNPYTGASVFNLAGAVGTTAEDFLKGILAATQGDAQGATKLLPNFLKRPARLLMNEGDVRDSRGGLIQELTPGQQLLTLLGLPPRSVETKRDISEATRKTDEARRDREMRYADELATALRKDGPGALQGAIYELSQKLDPETLTKVIRQAKSRYERQLRPYDWRREVNVGPGVRSFDPSTALLGRQLQQQFMQAAGMQDLPDIRGDQQASMVDQLLNSGQAQTESEAKRLLRSLENPGRRSRIPSFVMPY